MSILDGLDILSTLSDQDKKNLELFCQPRVLLAGEELFAEWDDANAMYFLKSGSLSIHKRVNGCSVHLGDVHAEEVIGEMALFGENDKRMASANALEYSELVTILLFSINKIITQYPELLDKIKKIIRLRNSENKKNLWVMILKHKKTAWLQGKNSYNKSF